MSNWISVSQRLPEIHQLTGMRPHSDYVLVTDGQDVDMCALIDGVWRAAYSGERVDERHITHWQPLPEPPHD